MLKWKFLCPNNFGSIWVVGYTQSFTLKGSLLLSDMKHVDSINFGLMSSYMRFTGYAVGPGTPLLFFFPVNVGAIKFFESFILSYSGLNEGIYWLYVQGPNSFSFFYFRT